MSEKLKHELNSENCPDNAASHSNSISDDLFENLFLNECIISATLEKILTTCQANDIKTDERHNQILNLIKLYENEIDSRKKYIEITAECQRTTAECANNQIERLMLNPAIETIFLLSTTLRQLHEQSQDLLRNQDFCPLIKSIINSIAEASKIAQSKCQYLGIEEISPVEFDDFNPHEHEIKQSVETNDDNKHKKIKQTLKPGTKYRGKILHQAMVSVYRLVKVN